MIYFYVCIVCFVGLFCNFFWGGGVVFVLFLFFVVLGLLFFVFFFWGGGGVVVIFVWFSNTEDLAVKIFDGRPGNLCSKDCLSAFISVIVSKTSSLA